MRKVPAALLAAPLLSGCGALLTPSTYPIPVDSEPPGAAVLVDGQQLGTTPCTIALPRRSRMIELHRPGYHLQTVHVGDERNHWVGLNCLTLGLGFAVDFALGFDRRPHVAPMSVRLSPTVAPTPGVVAREYHPPALMIPTPTGLGEAIGSLAKMAADSYRW